MAICIAQSIDTFCNSSMDFMCTFVMLSKNASNIFLYCLDVAKSLNLSCVDHLQLRTWSVNLKPIQHVYYSYSVLGHATFHLCIMLV